MANRYEDLELDEGYWRVLLAEAEHMPIPATRPEGAARQAASEFTSAAPHDHDAMWASLERMKRDGEALEVEVTGCNRGGLIVMYRGLRGFVPSSHVHSISPECDELERRAGLAGNIGHTLSVRIIELDSAQERVVFSERELQSEGEPHEIPQVLFEIHAGDTCRGVVTNLTAFGAFVDLGGYEGLVHVSELAWSRVNHPRDLLHIGQEVDAYVMSISPQEGRIALSLKRAKHNPWEGIEQRYHIGQTVRGIVTNVVQFGAFIKVEEDLEGLVHVSELAEGGFLHPRSIIHEGDEVTARVISVDAQQRRLALSMRSVEDVEH